MSMSRGIDGFPAASSASASGVAERRKVARTLAATESICSASSAGSSYFGVPDTVGFATKPQLARRLITTAVAGGLPCRWVAGDEAYGGDPQLAAALRGHRLSYVLAVACSHQVPTGLGIARADQIAAGLPCTAWQRLSAGTGGERFPFL